MGGLPVGAQAVAALLPDVAVAGALPAAAAAGRGGEGMWEGRGLWEGWGQRYPHTMLVALHNSRTWDVGGELLSWFMEPEEELCAVAACQHLQARALLHCQLRWPGMQP